MNLGTLTKSTPGLRVAQLLFYLDGAVWLTLGVFTLARHLTRTDVDGSPMMLLVTVLMLGNSAVMIAAGVELARRKQAAYFFALVVLMVNILLTLTDQFGLIDFMTLMLDLVLLLLLLLRRTEFVAPKS